MKLIHLSDLHFGCDRNDVVENLLQSIAPLEPDLVVISGDITERARPSQFRMARAFLRRISVPWLCVPGIHDLPVFNLLSRFVTPFRGYKQFIHPRTEVGWIGQGVAIYGLNTTQRIQSSLRPFRTRLLKATRAFFASAPADFRKILVVHQPRLPFFEIDVDLILCSHLSHGSKRVTVVPGRVRDTVVIAAGTAISKRETDDTNSFNEIIVERDRFHLRVHRWNAQNFVPGLWLEYPYHSLDSASPLSPESGVSLVDSTETGPRSP